MKCPLTFIKSVSGYLETKFDVGDCLKEECAWWDLKLRICSTLKIAKELSFVSESMTYLLAKVPKGGKA